MLILFRCWIRCTFVTIVNNLTIFYLFIIETFIWFAQTKNEKNFIIFVKWIDFDAKMMFQLRMKMLQKFSKKQFIVRIEIRYHKNVNDIIFEIQRFFFVVSISIMIELKIRQIKQKIKIQKKNEQNKSKTKNYNLSSIIIARNLNVSTTNFKMKMLKINALFITIIIIFLLKTSLTNDMI